MMPTIRVIAIAGTSILIGTIVLALLAAKESWFDRQTAELLLTAMLTISTAGYALLVFLSLEQSKEASVQPKLVLDMIRVFDEGRGVGIRILNGGNGPALDISFKMISEPSAGAWELSKLEALKEGLPSLPAGEYRVLSTGRAFEELRQRLDFKYDVEVAYRSLAGQTYVHNFTIRAPIDRHWLTSSLPAHHEHL